MDLPIVRPRFPDLNDINNSEFRNRIAGVLATGNVTNNGPYVQQLERALAAYLGAPTLCFSSGMAALTTMLIASKVFDKEIICPSFTFAATPHAIRLSHNTPVFCDIDDTLCMSLEEVKNRMDGRTVGAVLAVDPYGILADDAGISKVCRDYQIPLLIDSAAAFGSVGASPRGEAQIFSFHATKPFSTMEGGCLVSRNPLMIERARMIRNFGQDPSGEVRMVGFNGKMTEICAIIGLEQLKEWIEVSMWRRAVATAMYRDLHKITGISMPPWSDAIWTYMPIQIMPEFGKPRDQVMAELKERGIYTRKYYSPPCHKMMTYPRGICRPNTELASDRVIALPVYNDMSQEEVKRIVGALKEVRDEDSGVRSGRVHRDSSVRGAGKRTQRNSR